MADQTSESPITPLNKNIISALKSACVRKGINDKQDIKDDEHWAEFIKRFNNLKGLDEPNKPFPSNPLNGNESNQHLSFKVIPRLYSRPPPEDDVVRQKLREEARAHFLQRKGRELLNNEELQALWFILEKHYTPNPLTESVAPPSEDAGASVSISSAFGGGEDRKISYADFIRARDAAAPKCRPYFTASTFAKLYSNDNFGRISIVQFFNYVMRKVWLQQTRIGLSLYDVTGLGYLRESDLESYILELIPTLPQLDCLDKSFYTFYACTAVRKFFFFLDPLRTGRVKILDILACGFLDDLLELRDEDASKASLEANWFSASSVLRVYGQYLALDRDHNGMLSPAELVRYGTGTLTPVFVHRVFEEYLTYEGELDYKSYLDFVLAVEHKKEPQALQYFFRLLDIEHKSALSVFDLKYFFKAIQEQMMQIKAEPVPFQDVSDEIFDMVRPKDPMRITLQDLISSGVGDVVVSILTDLNGFFMYENREALVLEVPQTAPGASAAAAEFVSLAVSGSLQQQQAGGTKPPDAAAAPPSTTAAATPTTADGSTAASSLAAAEDASKAASSAADSSAPASASPVNATTTLITASATTDALTSNTPSTTTPTSCTLT